MGTETIGLVPMTADHLELVAGWLADPAINRWLNSEWRGKECNPRMVAVALRNSRMRMHIVNYGMVPCGLMALYDIDETDQTASLWYLLGEKEFANRGVISIALKQLVSWAFSELKLASLAAWVMADNIPSCKVLEKAGFQAAGRIRKSVLSGGRLVDRLWYDRIGDDVL